MLDPAIDERMGLLGPPTAEDSKRLLGATVCFVALHTGLFSPLNLLARTSVSVGMHERLLLAVSTHLQSDIRNNSIWGLDRTLNQHATGMAAGKKEVPPRKWKLPF